jgi:Flp pilus assembly protein TadD
MDALKKAEEEKKRAAKRLQEVEGGAREELDDSIEADIQTDDQSYDDENQTPQILTETVELSLEPMPQDVKAELYEEETPLEKSDTVSQELEVPTVDEPEGLSQSETFSEDITLENPTLENAIAEDNFEQTQKVVDLNDTTIIEGLSTENASAPFDDTFHGVLFDEEEERGTDVYEETLPGVPAEQLVKDLGGGEFQPTPVAAQTVFSAGNTKNNQRSFKWGIFVVLALLAVGSFAVFYYFTITPVARKLPSPMIARGVESIPMPPPPISLPPEPEVVSGTTINSANEEDMKKIVQEIPAEQVETSEVITEITSTDEKQIIEPVKEEASELNETIVDSSIAIEAIALTDETTSEPDATLSVDEPVINEVIPDKVDTSELAKPVSENKQIDPSLISISKNKTLKKESEMVHQAFKAYQAGHYDAAKSLYNNVLKNDPDNRDTHLGLAAIAINNRDRESAYSHYVHLLELNPADPLALNGLIGLSSSADLVRDESAIKTLIQKEGDVPYLYFSLGNIFAKQNRWAEAQQAFFNAYRLDTTNPSYVLNLAISLDKIGQYDTALDFYRTAIDLSQNSPAKLDFSSVNSRIFALSKLVESKL